MRTCVAIESELDAVAAAMNDQPQPRAEPTAGFAGLPEIEARKTIQLAVSARAEPL
jgi:hypothetical protein